MAVHSRTFGYYRLLVSVSAFHAARQQPFLPRDWIQDQIKPQGDHNMSAELCRRAIADGIAGVKADCAAINADLDRLDVRLSSMRVEVQDARPWILVAGVVMVLGIVAGALVVTRLL